MNSDKGSELAGLHDLVRQFAAERDWLQFHTPKDLGLALASEVGEVLDLLRFRSERQIAQALATPEGHQAIAHELADCFWALLRLADVCQVDLAASLHEKVALAALKYPIDRSSGRNDKYTAYQDSPTRPTAPTDGPPLSSWPSEDPAES